ncbi:amidophosphoribosyltransferase [Arapaima gigas]
MESEESGLTEECGVFGCVAAGQWPTQLEVTEVLALGLVALQHSLQKLGLLGGLRGPAVCLHNPTPTHVDPGGESSFG